jgi:hypothetical protein
MILERAAKKRKPVSAIPKYTAFIPVKTKVPGIGCGMILSHHRATITRNGNGSARKTI